MNKETVFMYLMSWMLVLGLLLSACNVGEKNVDKSPSETLVNGVEDSGIPVIIDTDANNELDDQHALAYLFFNETVFDIRGVTVNATFNGGDINEHVKEAERVLHLCNVSDKYPVVAGANSDFEEILSTTARSNYDGKDAIDFIIAEARKPRSQKLVLLPVGKLTNIALAIQLAPDIKKKVRIVWLGSNYPDEGEYNQINDPMALNYLLDQDVPFEIVTVRYGMSTGSDAVKATPDDIETHMPGAGREVDPIAGRHGGSFTNFGDYSVELFKHIDLHGDPPARALFDMVAVAILKNPSWGENIDIPAPKLVGERWQHRPQNTRFIKVWENFTTEEILHDFYTVMAGARDRM